MAYIGKTPTAVPLTSADIQDGTVGLADLSATGTKDATTFLRGDNTFAEAGGGKVLQVLSATDSTQRQTSSSTFVTASNTLSVDITPSSSSSKILVLINCSVYGNNNSNHYLTIFRDSTNLGNSVGGMARLYFTNVSEINTAGGISYLDSPSSTSTLTYQLYIRSTGGTFLLNGDSNQQSHITVMEIGG